MTPDRLTEALRVRGFADPGVDDPLRDFMATYFDHDDDVTRGMVIDYLGRITAALATRPEPGEDGLRALGRMIERIERHVDHECGADHRYAFMEDIRLIAGDVEPALRAPVADEGLERSSETFPLGFGCPCCDGTGFVSDDMADRLRAVNAFPPDARLAADTEPAPYDEMLLGADPTEEHVADAWSER